jgi:murein DD-endopeptidase MepM/ murein hydrolase activator NlpD
MAHFHRNQGRRILRGIWFIIAGSLLLGHTSVLAESHIRLYKKGVVYYHFPIREHPQTSAPPTRTALPEVDQSQNLQAMIIAAAIRLEAKRDPETSSLKGAPSLRQLRLGKAHDLQVADFYDPDKNTWTGAQYLKKMLTTLGYHSPLAAAAHNPVSRRTDRLQALPPTQEAQALFREVCSSFLQYELNRHATSGQTKPDPVQLAESPWPAYCFPVAWPFSFRDTWGDRRGGGRYHRGVDILAGEGTPVYAITAGVVHKLANWPGAGITLLLRGQDGKGYGYMHLKGYAKGMVEGKTVQKGELIAYVGRTGIVWDSTSHLHFQVYVDHNFERDELVNPFGFLVQLCNGKGVTDMARRSIAGPQVTRHGKMKIYTFVPRGPKVHQRSDEDVSTLLTNYLLKKDQLTTPAKPIP